VDEVFPLGPDMPLVVPLKRPADLDRVGEVAKRISTVFGSPIEVVAILCPDDDVADEFSRFAAQVDMLGNGDGVDVSLRIIVSEQTPETFFSYCAGATTCMATSASPFKDGHYVGSFAAGLLAKTTAPVLLVGPAVPAGLAAPYDEVVAAVSDSPESQHVLPVARAFASSLDLPMARVNIDTDAGIVYTSRYHDPEDCLPDSVRASITPGAIDVDHVDETILERNEGTLLAVATHARQGLAWIAEGSVAFSLVSESKAPVLVIGPHYHAWEGPSDDGSVDLDADEGTGPEGADVDGEVVVLAAADVDAAATELVDWIEAHPNSTIELIEFRT